MVTLRRASAVPAYFVRTRVRARAQGGRQLSPTRGETPHTRVCATLLRDDREDIHLDELAIERRRCRWHVGDDERCAVLIAILELQRVVVSTRVRRSEAHSNEERCIGVGAVTELAVDVGTPTERVASTSAHECD